MFHNENFNNKINEINCNLTLSVEDKNILLNYYNTKYNNLTNLNNLNNLNKMNNFNNITKLNNNFINYNNLNKINNNYHANSFSYTSRLNDDGTKTISKVIYVNNNGKIESKNVEYKIDRFGNTIDFN
jgi:hypothetical protein